jgi:putative endonuclease
MWLAMERAKRFVYILRSQIDPRRYDTGLASDVPARLAAHNAGRSTHTATGQPRELLVVVEFVEFADEQRAGRFERYLKSGSGCAFAKRHFR